MCPLLNLRWCDQNFYSFIELHILPYYACMSLAYPCSFVSYFLSKEVFTCSQASYVSFHFLLPIFLTIHNKLLRIMIGHNFSLSWQSRERTIYHFRVTCVCVWLDIALGPKINEWVSGFYLELKNIGVPYVCNKEMKITVCTLGMIMYLYTCS